MQAMIQSERKLESRLLKARKKTIKVWKKSSLETTEVGATLTEQKYSHVKIYWTMAGVKLRKIVFIYGRFTYQFS